jgi:hypothetical protein
MTASHKLALLAGAFALSATIASAQTPDTRIIVHGAINAPAHTQQVTDGRDDAVPEMPVIQETQAQATPAAAQPASSRNANQATLQPASASRTNLNQAVKSQ